jgi:carbon monoxide dehydrogenase subunit G
MPLNAPWAFAFARRRSPRSACGGHFETVIGTLGAIGMKIDGRIPVAADPNDVWQLVIDPIALSSCIPGVQNLRQVNDRSFEGTITASVGPIDGNFLFTSLIERNTYPDLVVTLTGLDSVTSSRLEAQITAVIVEIPDGSTELEYHATIGVKGRLAILGEMVLRATANLMIGQVTACLRSRLESSGAQR